MSSSPPLETAAGTGAEIGFVGLGNMGQALAANLVTSGFEVLAHDIAGPDGTPEGATFTPRIAAVAERCSTVVFSLPDGTASASVAQALLDSPVTRVEHVIDTSTVGLDAAREIGHVLAAHGITLVDAPVSGGVAGARARTLAVMYAGSPTACAAAVPVLAGLSDRTYHVGDEPGMAQAVKLANNFLSATALAATSEAISFTTSVGLNMETVLEVLNASSGQSAATSDKFVNHVASGRFASGFTNSLMAKDVGLYLQAVLSQRSGAQVGSATAAIWQRFAETRPGEDFTQIYPFVDGS